MPNLLQAFTNVAPFINDLTTNDISVALCDTEKYVLIVPSKGIPNPNVKVGQPVPENTVITDAMRSGRRMVKKCSADVVGVPYIACAIPLIENGELIGGACFLITTDKQEKMMEIADRLAEGASQLSASSGLIERESDGLVSIYHEMSGLSNGLNSYINETDDVLKMIENFSRQTNLLGLNASVEAARVGNVGQGFGIIAGETRKLASDITDSIKKIEDIFEMMKELSGDQKGIIKRIDNVISAQSESIKKVNASIKSLNETVNELVADTEKLVED